MSGASNVNFWLEERGIASSERLVSEILKEAKKEDHILTTDEVMGVVTRVRAEEAAS